MKGTRKVLVAVNGSLQVLEEGLKVAENEGSWVTVLKVVPPYEGDINITGIKNIEDVLNSGAAEASSAIEEVLRKDRSIAKVRVEAGDIPATIAEVAAEERCDLIIMGTKGKKGLLRRLIGDNVVGKVAAVAPCPVLIVNA